MGMATSEAKPARYSAAGSLSAMCRSSITRLSRIDQVRQDPSLEEGQQVLLFPGVDVACPGRAASNPVPGRIQPAAAQREPGDIRQEMADSVAVGPHHLLRVIVPAHVAHGV